MRTCSALVIAALICSLPCGSVEGNDLFIRGDTNGDGAINIVDPVQALNYLFAGGSVTCLEAIDADSNGMLNLADPVYLLTYTFISGPAPASPFPNCGAPATYIFGCDSNATCGPQTQAPTNLVYDSMDVVYTVQVPIAPNTPATSGGLPCLFEAAPPLPAGLDLDPMTGVISGTPTAAAPQASYTITASNDAGSTSANLLVTVLPQAPTSLSYSLPVAVYETGTTIAPNVPSVTGGAPDMYTVAPVLPLGLSIDPSTGVISGAPSVLSAAADYTVTASNAAGSVMATVNITVVDSTDPLAALSDGFDGTSLDPSWQMLNGSLVGITVTNSTLQLEPVDNSLWFDDSEGPFLFKEVTGDFTVTASIHARRISDPSLPPVVPYRLGGLMARNPSSALENYVFIVVGADGNDLSVETKSTQDSVSTFVGPPWPSAEGQIRICRRGDTFTLYIRELGTTSWSQQNTFVRPDLPATLQVGPVTYANAAPADVRITYDEVTYATATTTADCTN